MGWGLQGNPLKEDYESNMGGCSTTAIHLPGENGTSWTMWTWWSPLVSESERGKEPEEEEWEQGSERKPKKDHAEEELLFTDLRTFLTRCRFSPLSIDGVVLVDLIT